MCSYQRINNSYGCNNSLTLNGLLKTELGFEVRVEKLPKPCKRLLSKGFVVSDWDAKNAGTATARAGLDMAMPNGDRFWHGKLAEAVLGQQVSEARLDDMVHR